MSSRGGCCRNCMHASPPPAARSSSTAKPIPRRCDGIVVDCRGLAARDTQPDLRGVKGEMIVIETDEVELSRPVRLIHPRFPLYVIPRGDGRFMLGATSIEAEHDGVSVRSALELLGAAYAVHPAFAEARIVEFGAGLRPAFPDNLPRIAIDQHNIAVNGLLPPRLPAGAGAGGADARLCRARGDRQRGDAMRVIVNGEPREISSPSVDALLGELDYDRHPFRDRAEFRRAAAQPLGRHRAQEPATRSRSSRRGREGDGESCMQLAVIARLTGTHTPRPLECRGTGATNTWMRPRTSPAMTATQERRQLRAMTPC